MDRSNQLLLGESVASIIGVYLGISISATVILGLLASSIGFCLGVFERSDEFNLLEALGWKRSSLTKLIIIEGALIGAFGGIFVASVAVIVDLVLTGVITDTICMWLGLIIAASPLMGCVAAIYPAYTLRKFLNKH